MNEKEAQLTFPTQKKKLPKMKKASCQFCHHPNFTPILVIYLENINWFQLENSETACKLRSEIDHTLQRRPPCSFPPNLMKTKTSSISRSSNQFQFNPTINQNTRLNCARTILPFFAFLLADWFILLFTLFYWFVFNFLAEWLPHFLITIFLKTYFAHSFSLHLFVCFEKIKTLDEQKGKKHKKKRREAVNCQSINRVTDNKQHNHIQHISAPLQTTFLLVLW